MLFLITFWTFENKHINLYLLELSDCSCVFCKFQKSWNKAFLKLAIDKGLVLSKLSLLHIPLGDKEDLFLLLSFVSSKTSTLTIAKASSWAFIFIYWFDLLFYVTRFWEISCLIKECLWVKSVHRCYLVWCWVAA